MRRGGFTLPEIVVVVLVIGILATASASKLFSNATTARDHAARQSLLVVREAIELFRAENSGTFPGAAGDFYADIADHLSGPFPTCPIGTRDNLVSITADTNITADASPTTSWKYSTASGEFIINSGDTTTVQTGTTYDMW